MTTEHTRPMGPLGTPFELAEKIRERIAQGEVDFDKLAWEAGVDVEVVRRIYRHMRDRAKRVAKRQHASP